MMRIFRRFKAILTEDEKFLEAIESIEGIVSKILSIGMIFVTFIAIAHLSYALIEKLLLTVERQSNDSFNTTLFELFGLFLNVLIALEILENITAYLRKHVIQVELVIVTSLIAVSRKIIILDLEKKSSSDLIALAVAVFSLSIGYAIVHQTNKRYSNPK
ncbi:MAG: phosphate-starvation-inducible PsiE family protein [Chamaesiphon sp.]|nr:phosphate-starvation-inducible PsiE family protein [Chamaesiphon sp.]